MTTLPRPRFLTVLPFAAVMLLMIHPARAGAKFSGDTGFKLVNDGKSVSISAGAISNSSREYASGTLIVRLMALDAPYVGKSTNGKLLASYKLDRLHPARQYAPFRKTLTYNAPSVKKRYHVCLMLMELRGNGYVVADYRNMPGTQILGPLKKVYLTGPFQWKSHAKAGTVDINIGKISHRRSEATGSLRISLWATGEPFKGGKISGYLLGTVTKTALKSGFCYTDVKHTAKYSPPPEGTYFTTIMISEYGSDETFHLMDYHTMSKPSTFGTPTP